MIARFSNGSPRPNGNDAEPDSRGFGLKVLGVEGEALLKGVAGGERGGTQEFTMNSSDAFFADTAKTYARFMQIALHETPTFGEAAKNHVIELFTRFHPFLAWRVLKAFNKIKAVETTNPLAIPYFSITPFQHGAGNSAPIVKYALFPVEAHWQGGSADN